jgi:hypothetical protein
MEIAPGDLPVPLAPTDLPLVVEVDVERERELLRLEALLVDGVLQPGELADEDALRGILSHWSTPTCGGAR